MQEYYIFNALIINEGDRYPGALHVRDGKIAGVFRGGAPAGYGFGEKVTQIDARQSFLIPGVIDVHVHFREPGLTEKADIATETRAAIAGGVTSFMDMPNTIPNATTLERLEEKYAIASKKSLANYSFYLGASADNLEEIKKADPSRICGLKLFMGSSTGNMTVGDTDTLELIFRESPLLISVHAEDDDLIHENLKVALEHFTDGIPPEAHPFIRNDEVCFRAAARAVALAEKYHARMHLAHLSTVKELALLRNDIPLKEKRITGEVCVHHLWFDDNDYQTLGNLIKWNPAIKTDSDRTGLLRGVEENLIDLIATDHAPHLRPDKEKPYTECPSGAPLIQHSLVAMMSFYHNSKLSMPALVEKMCHAPASLFRIKNRGFLREGYAADLVLVNPDDPWTVDKETILSKCGWSPMEGVTFKSRVTHTWVNGQLVFNQGRFDSTIRGERLEFSVD